MQQLCEESNHDLLGRYNPFTLRGTTDPIKYHRMPVARSDRDIQSDLFTVFVFVLVKKEHEGGAPLRATRDRRNKSRSRTPQRPTRPSSRQASSAPQPMETDTVHSSSDARSDSKKPAATTHATAKPAPTYARMPSTETVNNSSTFLLRRQRPSSRTSTPRRRQRNTYDSYIEASDEAFLNQDVRPAAPTAVESSFESAKQDDSNEVSDDSLNYF